MLSREGAPWCTGSLPNSYMPCSPDIRRDIKLYDEEGLAQSCDTVPHKLGLGLVKVLNRLMSGVRVRVRVSKSY